jgi:hypothetical protein
MVHTEKMSLIKNHNKMDQYDQMEWLDNLLEEDLKVSFLRLIWMDELIRRSVLEERYKCDLEARVEYYTEQELNELAFYLMNKMPCPIDNGLNYNQGDIQKKLTRLCK